MQADYWSAQHDADALALQHFATNMAIPWAQFKADLAVARHDWWETQRDAYLAWCASIAAAEAAFQTLVGAAWSARSSTMGAADTVYVSTLANADETQFVSTSQADEVYVESMAGAYQTYQASLALADRDFTVNVAAAQRNFDIDGNQAVFDSAVAAATATRAEACRAAGDAYGRTRVAADDQRRVAQAQAQFVYAQAAGPANVAWVESYAAAKLTFVTAQGTAHVASVTDVANDRTAYRTQEATSLASVMVVFATAHPSPWATYTRDTIDAWRDLVVATAPAEATYEIALATSQAASEIAQTVAENTFDIAVAQAGAQDWLAAAQAGLDQANGERQADVAFAAAAGQAAPQGLPGKQPQPPSPPPPPLQPGAPVPTPAQVTAETYGAGQGQSGTVGSTASISMEAPDPNAVEPTRTPSNRGSSADGEENPYAYGSDKWFDWKIKRNGGKLRAGMSFNESNKRVAEDVRPVLEVTGDLCLSAATGPYRDIIEIGTGKDMWDQRELSGTERTVKAALTFGIPLVGAVVGNFIEYGSKLARGVNRASRAGEQVEDVLQSGLRMGSNVGHNKTLTSVLDGRLPRGDVLASPDLIRQMVKRHGFDNSDTAVARLLARGNVADINAITRKVSALKDARRIELYEEKIHSSILDIMKRSKQWDGVSAITEHQRLLIELDTHRWLISKADDLRLTSREVAALRDRLAWWEFRGDMHFGIMPKRK